MFDLDRKCRTMACMVTSEVTINSTRSCDVTGNQMAQRLRDVSFILMSRVAGLDPSHSHASVAKP